MEGFQKTSLWCTYVDMISETLSHKFHPYSILSGQIMVESDGYCVLSRLHIFKRDEDDLRIIFDKRPKF